MMKSFSLASVVTLSGIALFVGAAAACGGSDAATPADAGSSGNSSGTSGASGEAGGQGTSGGTSSGDGGGTSSGSVDFGDAGFTDPSTVEGIVIPFKKCDAFKKCDGSIKGSWKIVGGCLPDDTFDSYKSFCDGFSAHDVIIKASGTVDATEAPNLVTQKTSIFLQAQVDVPVSCTALFGGCDGVAALLEAGASGGTKFDHAACKQNGDTCKCKGDVTVKEDTADKYTTSGDGTLSTGDDPKRTYDYCKTGDKLTYHETTSKNKTFGMLLDLGPK